jgi:hypothetical protein
VVDGFAAGLVGGWRLGAAVGALNGFNGPGIGISGPSPLPLVAVSSTGVTIRA